MLGLNVEGSGLQASGSTGQLPASLSFSCSLFFCFCLNIFSLTAKVAKRLKPRLVDKTFSNTALFRSIPYIMPGLLPKHRGLLRADPIALAHHLSHGIYTHIIPLGRDSYTHQTHGCHHDCPQAHPLNAPSYLTRLIWVSKGCPNYRIHLRICQQPCLAERRLLLHARCRRPSCWTAFLLRCHLEPLQCTGTRVD